MQPRMVRSLLYAPGQHRPREVSVIGKAEVVRDPGEVVADMVDELRIAGLLHVAIPIIHFAALGLLPRCLWARQRLIVLIEPWLADALARTKSRGKWMS